MAKISIQPTRVKSSGAYPGFVGVTGGGQYVRTFEIIDFPIPAGNTQKVIFRFRHSSAGGAIHGGPVISIGKDRYPINYKFDTEEFIDITHSVLNLKPHLNEDGSWVREFSILLEPSEKEPWRTGTSYVMQVSGYSLEVDEYDGGDEIDTNESKLSASFDVILNDDQSVEFVNKSAHGYTGVQWDYGDGQSGFEVNPRHTYISPGSYTAVLTITKGADRSSASHSLVIERSKRIPDEHIDIKPPPISPQPVIASTPEPGTPPPINIPKPKPSPVPGPVGVPMPGPVGIPVIKPGSPITPGPVGIPIESPGKLNISMVLPPMPGIGPPLPRFLNLTWDKIAGIIKRK